MILIIYRLLESILLPDVGWRILENVPYILNINEKICGPENRLSNLPDYSVLILATFNT